MRAGGRGRNPRTGCDPLLVCHELQAELVVEDTQIPVASAHNRIRPEGLYLLRHDADIGLIAAVVAESIKAEAIAEVTEQVDVVLERDIRAPSAATASTATTPASTAAAATEAATAATAHAHSTTATSTETGVTA